VDSSEECRRQAVAEPWEGAWAAEFNRISFNFDDKVFVERLEAVW
jgi:hypothetical protein